LLVFVLASGNASALPPGDLAPGADLSDCRSALHLGPAVCEDPPKPPAAEAPTTASGPGPAHAAEALEDRVDAYLSAYGKPPREAVRALLEPSDAHIRDYLRKQQETLAIAAYVAARMTALQDATPQPAANAWPAAADNAVFGQMRVWLVQSAFDTQTQEAQWALRELARQAPQLQAGVVLVGNLTPQALRREIGRIDPLLAVESRAPDTEDSELLPYLRIEDLRNRRFLAFSARSVSAAELARQIAAVRQGGTSERRTARAPSEGNPGP
jgi:hypothetical protein